MAAMKTTLLLFASALIAAPQTMTERLQKGLLEEEAQHNLPAAIEEYKAVIAEADQQRRLAATAVYRLAESYRKLGRTDEAAAMYERLRRDFSDQTQLVERASIHLPKRRDISELAISPPGNDFAGLARLLQNSPDLLNAPATNGMTFLQHAATSGNLELMEFLHKKGAKLEATTRDSLETPLMIAVGRGHKSAAEFLLKSGADVNARDSNGSQAPLHVAAQQGYAELSRVLLANGADPNAEVRGWTPLHYAAKNGLVEVIDLLVKAGAKLEAVEETGATPLILAIVGQNRFNNPNLSYPNPAAVRALLNAGADPNNQGRTPEPPLLRAVKSPNWEIFEILIAHPRVDVNGKSRLGETPLIQAITQPREDAVSALLERKANVNQRGPNGETALHAAVAKGYLTLAKLLLENGADPNLQNDTGRTPVHFACGANSAQEAPVSFEILQLLLEHKANPNIRERYGYTPLDYALWKESPKTVEILLAAKADPNALTFPGRSQLQNSLSERHIAIRDLLRNAGATNSALFPTNSADSGAPAQLPNADPAEQYFRQHLERGKRERQGIPAPVLPPAR